MPVETLGFWSNLLENNMQAIIKQLTLLEDPAIGKNLAERVQQEGDAVCIHCPYVVDERFGDNHHRLAQVIEAAGIDMGNIKFRFIAPRPPNKPESKSKQYPVLGNIIAVGSGKGGVGKSTVSSGIARSLSTLGARVGILDGDIYGANQDILMGLPENSRTKVNANKDFIPFDVDGIALMSFAGVAGADVPVVWRGPMIAKALQQMISTTDWPQLDYLIVDLPPGTGDIQLTLFQQTQIAGFVLVTTPQRMAIDEAGKTLSMVEKLGIDRLGAVENMNKFVCSSCTTEHYIFAQGTEQLLEKKQIALLGSLPINTDLHGDRGQFVFDASNAAGQEFISIAEKITVALVKKSIIQRGAVITSG